MIKLLIGDFEFGIGVFRIGEWGFKIEVWGKIYMGKTPIPNSKSPMVILSPIGDFNF